MSKIGIKPIEIPQEVTIDIDKNVIKVKSNQEEINIILPDQLGINKKDNQLQITRNSDIKKTKSVHGLFRQLIYNAITGLVKPWEKRLEIVGTGFNVKLEGENLVFRLGFNHPVIFKKVAGIKFQVEGNNKVIVSGSDKQLVGQTAYRIKILKKPDAYKGKGIRYEGEKLRIKPGKKAKATTGAAGGAA